MSLPSPSLVAPELVSSWPRNSTQGISGAPSDCSCLQNVSFVPPNMEAKGEESISSLINTQLQTWTANDLYTKDSFSLMMSAPSQGWQSYYCPPQRSQRLEDLIRYHPESPLPPTRPRLPSLLAQSRFLPHFEASPVLS